MTETTTNTTRKVVLIGDGSTGKTAFIKKLMTGEFERKYVATLGVEVSPLHINGITFNVWDCAGQEKFGGLRDGYYVQADCAIVMFDWSSEISIKSSQQWIVDFTRVCPGKQYIIMGNKIELAKPSVYNKYRNMPNLINISVKENTNLSLPFACFD